jgi:hypothetical protein
MYAGVPARTFAVSPAVARLKSITRTLPAPSSITLAGFRSRCSTPRSCAAARPAQSCRAMSIALSSGTGRCGGATSRDPSPSTYSIERIRLTVHFADVVNAADVRGATPARHPHFVMQLRQPDGVVLERRRQELQRDGLTETQVVRTIDFAHPAPAEETDDAVPSIEHGPRRKSPVVDRARRRQPPARARGPRRAST